MSGVQWSKLLMNLNNALNALSGLSLVDELSDYRWRRLLAAQVAEAIACLRAHGIAMQRIGRVAPAMIPHVLRLPDWAFTVLARQMLTIDPSARSSMADDLERGLATEIDELQGAIIDLAERASLPVPTIAAVHRLTKFSEDRRQGSPRLSPNDVIAAI